ncbi:MAG: hypothetical protein M3Q03_20380, partial [Chloroflexota bacterium]|nr:hypothetical protein [Chloroflexota bacterium]
MARMEVDTLVVVRRVVIDLDDRSVPTPSRDAARRSGGVFPDWLGMPASWSIAEKPRHGLRGIAAGALLTVAAVALGDMTRRRSRLPALSVGSAAQALPSSARRTLPALPDDLSQ